MRYVCLMLIALCGVPGGCGRTQSPPPDPDRAMQEFQEKMEEMDRHEQEQAEKLQQ
jgi:hypothetical protein